MKRIMMAFALVVVVSMFGAYRHVRAQSAARPYGNVIPTENPSPPAALTSHTLITTYLDQGAPDTSLGSGFTAIDGPVTINCSNAAGCTVEVINTAEVGGNSASGNQWAICDQLDGSYAGICTYQATLPTNATYLTGTFNNTMSLSAGTHTVQSFAFTSSGGATLAQYSNAYHLYRP